MKCSKSEGFFNSEKSLTLSEKREMYDKFREIFRDISYIFREIQEFSDQFSYIFRELFSPESTLIFVPTFITVYTQLLDLRDDRRNINSYSTLVHYRR